MNFLQLLKIVESSKEFKEFKQKNLKAVLCAGFFILDFQQNADDYHLDYRTEEDIFSFSISAQNKISFKQEEIIDKSKLLGALDSNLKIKPELDKLREFCERELQINGIKSKLEKIIAVLQNSDGKAVWNLTCMCAGFAIITLRINASAGEIIEFNKRNLMDFVSIKKKDQ